MGLRPAPCCTTKRSTASIGCLKAAVATHVAHRNFCRRLRKPGKSGERTPTPAMMAGLTVELWTLERLYDEVSDKAWCDERSRRTARLIAAMERMR